MPFNNFLFQIIRQKVVQCWPDMRFIPFNRRHARTLYGATRPMGLKTEQTNLRIVCCVIEFLASRLNPRLISEVLTSWLHFTAKTCVIFTCVAAMFSMGSILLSSGLISLPILERCWETSSILNTPTLKNITSSEPSWITSFGLSIEPSNCPY